MENYEERGRHILTCSVNVDLSWNFVSTCVIATQVVNLLCGDIWNVQASRRFPTLGLRTQPPQKTSSVPAIICSDIAHHKNF